MQAASPKVHVERGLTDLQKWYQTLQQQLWADQQFAIPGSQYCWISHPICLQLPYFQHTMFYWSSLCMAWEYHSWNVILYECKRQTC